ncbi:MAG: hypothetical protein ACI9WU_000389, partial [Myxococcota bacterium]
MVGALAAVLIWLWVQYLPGYLLARLLVPDARGLERHLTALITGFMPVPLVYFLLGALSGLPMDAPLIFVASSSLILAGLAAAGPAVWRTPDIGRRDILVVLTAGLAIALWLVIGFRGIDAGDALTTIQHCLYVIALHGIHNDPTGSIALWDAMSGDFIHFMIHHDSTLNGMGELLYEQRLGNVPVLGVPLATLGMAGWVTSSIHASTIAGLASFLAARSAGASTRASALGAVLLVWGTTVFLGYHLNENGYALAAVAFFIHVALRPGVTPRGLIVLTGLIAGHLVGIRHTAVLFWPAVAIALLWQPGALRHRVGRLALWLLMVAPAAAPWLYINSVKLGGLLTHPKIHPDSGGRVVENTLGGWSFMFKPLQWPFTDQLVRTVWNPFPTLLWIPLWTAQCFGQLPTAVALLGVWRAAATRRTLVLLLLFALPHTLAIAWLEGVDWEQVTYAVPGLAPMGILFALGLDWSGVTSGLNGAATSRRRIAVAVATLSIVGAAYGIRTLEFPVDRRLVNAATFPDETPRVGGIDRNAERLTGLQILPRLPELRVERAGLFWQNLSAVAGAPDVDVIDELPVYPSGRLVLLSAYSLGKPRRYRFAVAPGPLRAAETPVRTAVWLHTMAFRFMAERLEVEVIRLEGRYRVNLKPVGHSDIPKDFTFWLNPWYPP